MNGTAEANRPSGYTFFFAHFLHLAKKKSWKGPKQRFKETFLYIFISYVYTVYEYTNTLTLYAADPNHKAGVKTKWTFPITNVSCFHG